jgi:DNA-binding NarL/FixJ family response regulator
MGRASTVPRWAVWSLAPRLSAGLPGTARASTEPRCDTGFKRPDGLVARGMTEACKKILCIDDDRAVAEMVAEDLAARGFEVTMAHDGQEGLVAILKTMPDLVLCDVNMPVMSGFDILKSLSGLAAQIGKIPFVFITALSDRESALEARRLGADDIIVKPIDFEILHTIISARLAGVARNEIWPSQVDLNEREIEALTWVARGKTSSEIATILGLAKRTVDFHLENARVKLGVGTRTEAVIKAAFGRLINP